MSHRMTTGLALGAVMVSAAACTTPNLEYSARVPAGAPVVADYRHVAVDRFRGPEGYWYADAFERMVADARFDGAPWFHLATSYSYPDGVFRGDIDILWLDERHDRRVVSRCVEWDGPFDCERRRDVVQHCVHYEVQVSAVPELVDEMTGRVIWRGRYPASASDEVCRDVGFVEDVGHGPWDQGGRRYPWSGHGFDHVYGSYVVDNLIREALHDTLAPIRRDIAPLNVRARARLIDEAIDPEAAADPRFGQALQAAKDDNVVGSCALWRALAADYPDAPGVKFNMGACLEASGAYEEAQQVYLDVSRMPVALPKTVQDALRQIQARRSGEAELERLLAAPPIPVPDS